MKRSNCSGGLLLLLVLSALSPVAGQTPSEAIVDPPRLSNTSPSPGVVGEGSALPRAGGARPYPGTEEQERAISWKLLVPNLVRDQKAIWLSPAEVVRGRHWKPAAALLLATAGLVALDPHDTPYFRRTNTFSGFNNSFSGRNTGLGTALLPLSFYAVGLARRDTYAQHTSLLAGEALADAEILATVMKSVDRRLRPSDLPPNGDFSDTWFKRRGRFISGRGSFPSGHTIAAFSVATVFANRYHRHRWVPWVAYGLAGLVGFSRVTLQSHFPSDVFAGGALGYVVGHYVVLHQH